MKEARCIDERISFVGDGLTGAYFDDEKKYRYSLWRRFHEDVCLTEMAVFIGLNPSTADETEDDPTIRRCSGFARDWGRGGFVMLNLFAYRATDPKAMKAERNPVGPINDDVLRAVTSVGNPVVCCWGNHGIHQDCWWRVKVILHGTCKRSVFHFGLTKAGQPRHPLYLLKSSMLIRWAR